MNYIRNFNNDLKTGEKAEELILSKFKTVIQPIIRQVMYKDGIINKDLQKCGVDAYIEKQESGFDVKARDYEYYRFKDILLETTSKIEKDTCGWLYKSNVVIYVWWNPLKTKFVDGYILYLQNIRSWLEVWKYKSIIAYSEQDGEFWSTKSILIPISSFPVGCIYRISRKEFIDNTQVTFNEYFD